MEVKSFDVGPILGNVSLESAHIFGRGHQPTGRSRQENSFGICRIREKGASDWSLPIIRFQQPHFDYSSVSVVNESSPSVTYEYQCGYIHVPDDEEPDLTGLFWSRVTIHQFKTPSDNKEDVLTFAFGSCRYLLKFFFGSIFDSRGDKVFASMAKEGLDQVLMLGDQIYADDLNIIGADDSVDSFLKRYRDVFSQPNDDKWSGYQAQRNQILAFIGCKKINKVVFLSGDVHASMAAELTCDDDPNFKVISIVSSPFFWPHPHPNQDTFDLTGTLQGNRKMKVKKLIDVFSEENYGKITATPTQLKIEIKDRKGQLKKSKMIEF